MNELPADPILQGVLWTWIVPALVFLITTFSAGLLYRHFSRQTTEPSGYQSSSRGSARPSPQQTSQGSSQDTSQSNGNNV